MPYKREIHLDPSPKFKNTWSLAPQNQILELSGHKTNSMYAELSGAIPIFYFLTILAIGFDVYLGFSVLAKSGVNIPVVVITVLADIFLAIFVYLFALRDKEYNQTYLNNNIFKLQLERKTKKNEENADEYKKRKANLTTEINELKGKVRRIKILRFFSSLAILCIAVWKIFTFMSVLPPNLNIFSIVKGKIVIVLAILTAAFHIIATEKSVASFWFNYIKNKELKEHRENGDDYNLDDKDKQDVDYNGNYKQDKKVNTELFVDESGKAKIEYVNIIWDDEIKYIMDNQSDDNAKRGIVIACKQTQIF